MDFVKQFQTLYSIKMVIHGCHGFYTNHMQIKLWKVHSITIVQLYVHTFEYYVILLSNIFVCKFMKKYNLVSNNCV